MSARDDLDRFDRDWQAFQRSLTNGSLRVYLAVTAGIGLGESKLALPPAMIPLVQKTLSDAASQARAKLVAAAKDEARRTLEEAE